MRNILICAAMALFLSGCSSVDMIRTSSSIYPVTDPNTINILKTKPDEKYIELGSVTTTGFSASQEASMHESIRAKASALGADAVIITSEGLIPESWGRHQRWATGVAIRYKD
jgi:type IV pilus biogenesis protein CpaD/CtpE